MATDGCAIEGYQPWTRNADELNSKIYLYPFIQGSARVLTYRHEPSPIIFSPSNPEPGDTVQNHLARVLRGELGLRALVVLP